MVGFCIVSRENVKILLKEAWHAHERLQINCEDREFSMPMAQLFIEIPELCEMEIPGSEVVMKFCAKKEDITLPEVIGSVFSTPISNFVVDDLEDGDEQTMIEFEQYFQDQVRLESPMQNFEETQNLFATPSPQLPLLDSRPPTPFAPSPSPARRSATPPVPLPVTKKPSPRWREKAKKRRSSLRKIDEEEEKEDDGRKSTPKRRSEMSETHAQAKKRRQSVEDVVEIDNNSLDDGVENEYYNSSIDDVEDQRREESVPMMELEDLNIDERYSLEREEEQEEVISGKTYENVKEDVLRRVEETNGKTKLSSLIPTSSDRKTAARSFFAVLDLAKRSKIAAPVQENPFDEIYLESVEN